VVLVERGGKRSFLEGRKKVVSEVGEGPQKKDDFTMRDLNTLESPPKASLVTKEFLRPGNETTEIFKHYH